MHIYYEYAYILVYEHAYMHTYLQEIMDSLPKGLKKRMQAETFMEYIEQVPLFANVSEATKVYAKNPCIHLCISGAHPWNKCPFVRI